MKIFVANFAAVKYCKNPVAISLSSPKFFNGESCKDLMPTWKMLEEYKHGHLSSKDYSYEYLELLIKRDVSFRNIFNNFSNNDRVVEFLCWERVGEFCHRYLVGYLFERFLDTKVKEIIPSGKTINLPYESIDKWLGK